MRIIEGFARNIRRTLYASHGICIFIESITVVMIAAKEKTELKDRLLGKNNALYPFSLEALRKIKFFFDELCCTK